MLIGELAKEAGVGKDTIRHYSDMGLLIVGERSAGSRTYVEYDPENVDRIKLIQGAKKMGFTLSEMRRLVEEYNEGSFTRADVATMLDEQLALVRTKIKSMQETEALLAKKLSEYSEVR